MHCVCEITGVTDDGALSTVRKVTTLAAKVLGPSGSTAGPSVAPSDPPAQPTESLRQLASLHAGRYLLMPFEAKKAELLKRI